MVKTVVTVDERARLRQAIDAAIQKTNDLRVPLTLIAQSWFKSNNAIFSLDGPGKYADLRDSYKKRKAKKYPVYPILKASGALAATLTDPQNPDSVNYIVNRSALFLGTRARTKNDAPYARYLQDGFTARDGSKVPGRPMVLFGNEQVAPAKLNNRVEAWRQLLLDWAEGALPASKRSDYLAAFDTVGGDV